MRNSHWWRRGQDAQTSPPAAFQAAGRRERGEAEDASNSGAAKAVPAGPGPRKRPLLRAGLVLVTIISLFYVVYSMERFHQNLVGPNLRFQAALAAGGLNMLGYEVRANGGRVSSRRFSLEVSRGCDGVEPTALFIAAVLALPAPLRRKLVGIAVGTLLLQVLNLVRIVSLFCTGVHFPDAFELMHVHVWQAVFVFAALLLWALWAWWVTAGTRRPSNAPA